VVSSAPGSQALCDVVQSDDGWPKALLRSAGVRFHQSLGALLDAAQRQGAVRADITLADVLDIFTGCVAIQRHQRPGESLVRAVTIVLDAMRSNPRQTTVTKLGIEPGNRNGTTSRNEITDDSHCPICGGSVRHTGTGRPARYCSPACRQKAHRQRSTRASVSRPAVS
jgi:hypothetical protein